MHKGHTACPEGLIDSDTCICIWSSRVHRISSAKKARRVFLGKGMVQVRLWNVRPEKGESSRK